MSGDAHKSCYTLPISTFATCYTEIRISRIVAGDHRAGGRTTGHVDVHGGHGDDDILGGIATGDWNRTPALAHRDTHHGLCMLVHAHDV